MGINPESDNHDLFGPLRVKNGKCSFASLAHLVNPFKKIRFDFSC